MDITTDGFGFMLAFGEPRAACHLPPPPLVLSRRRGMAPQATSPGSPSPTRSRREIWGDMGRYGEIELGPLHLLAPGAQPRRPLARPMNQPPTPIHPPGAHPGGPRPSPPRAGRRRHRRPRRARLRRLPRRAETEPRCEIARDLPKPDFRAGLKGAVGGGHGGGRGEL